MALFVATLSFLIFLYFIVIDKLNRPKVDIEAVSEEEAKAKRETEKIARRKEFEKQLKEYSENISKYLSEESRNQQYSATLDVSFGDVIKAFESGITEEVSDISFKIIRSSDDSLKELSKNFDDFRKLVAHLPIEHAYSYDYRHTANRAANLLAEISRGNCRCRTFNDTNTFLPNCAQEKGDIEILEEVSDRETYSTDYHYKCTRCGSTSIANVNWAGHGPFTTLRRTMLRQE